MARFPAHLRWICYLFGVLCFPFCLRNLCRLLQNTCPGSEKHPSLQVFCDLFIRYCQQQMFRSFFITPQPVHSFHFCSFLGGCRLVDLQANLSKGQRDLVQRQHVFSGLIRSCLGNMPDAEVWCISSILQSSAS